MRAIDGSVWLTQAEIAELFQTTPQNITQHIKTIYEDNELNQEATCKQYLQVQNEGERNIERSLKHYNLDIILAIGYRVRSTRGTSFRQWATTHLREYLVKGFVMDDERLKEPGRWDYFDELLQRIREIRTSEKRFYQKVKDVYSLSTDYQSNSELAKSFSKTVQNKMLFAVTGKTAAELIVQRANPTLPNMGLTSWKGSKVRKQDVTVSKNYLTNQELSELNRIVTMFLDYAEDQTLRRKVIYMRDWEENVDKFLNFNERNVLTNAGKVSHDQAEKLAHQHYDAFNHHRRNIELENSELEAIEELKKIEFEISKDKK